MDERNCIVLQNEEIVLKKRIYWEIEDGFEFSI